MVALLQPLGFRALPRPADCKTPPPPTNNCSSTRGSLASNNLAALSVSEYLLVLIISGWRPDRAMIQSAIDWCSPSDSGAKVNALRMTRFGNIMMVLNSGNKGKVKFGDAICSTLGELNPHFTALCTVRLPSCRTTKSSLPSKRSVPWLATMEPFVRVKVYVSNTNWGSQKMARPSSLKTMSPW